MDHNTSDSFLYTPTFSNSLNMPVWNCWKMNSLSHLTFWFHDWPAKRPWRPHYYLICMRWGLHSVCQSVIKPRKSQARQKIHSFAVSGSNIFCVLNLTNYDTIPYIDLFWNSDLFNIRSCGDVFKARTFNCDSTALGGEAPANAVQWLAENWEVASRVNSIG